MTVLADAPPDVRPVSFLELEITDSCQLTCPHHCYAQAGPLRGHGSLSDDQWRQVIYDAASIGITRVQFIGGEPTRRPGWDDLVRYALSCGLHVEIYSNLYAVRPQWWELFGHARVSLATSYYSDQPAEHDRVTGRTGSHQRTRANIAEAIGRGIQLRVGIIDVQEGQRIAQARADLEAIGVTDIRTDRVRAVGNAATALPSTAELCGNCADGRGAVMPDGRVSPCVVGRFLDAGNVTEQRLAQILRGPRWAALAASIPHREGACIPDSCTPKEDSCQPSPGAAGASATGGSRA